MRVNTSTTLLNASASEASSQAVPIDSRDRQDPSTTQTPAGFDGVLLSLMQQGANAQQSSQRLAAQTDRNVMRDSSDRQQGKKSMHFKENATSNAEQKLAGELRVGPTAIAEATLAGEQTATSDATGKDLGSQQSPRGSRERQARVAASPARAATSVDGAASRERLDGYASGANALMQTASGVDALRAESSQKAKAERAVKVVSETALGATRIRQNMAAFAVKESGPATASQASRSASPSPASASSPSASPTASGVSAAPTKPKPESFGHLTHAGTSARTKVLQQGVEQAVTQGLAVALKDGGGTATVRLAPESLGQLSLKLTVQDGEVRLQAQTQTDSARELLIDSVSVLKEALESKGLHVRELRVHGPLETEISTQKQDVFGRADETPTRDQDGHHGHNDGGGASDKRHQHSEREQLASRKDAVHGGEDSLDRAERDEHIEAASLEAGVFQWIA